jgi:hypothetical protein
MYITVDISPFTAVVLFAFCGWIVFTIVSHARRDS